jgi:recombination protein RecA
MAKIRKEQGEGAILLGSQIVPPLRPTITTGSLSLDAALGGGWATNHWAEIAGWESAGKTFLVLKTIAANQRLDPNWMTLWVATEDFSETYAEMLGVDIDRVIVYNENIMERVYDKCIQFLQTKGVDCIVIDSLPFLVSGREDEGDMDETQPGYPALLTGKFFRKSMGSIKRRLDLAEERNCTGLIINGWRDKFVKYGDPRTTPGGKGKNFVFFQRVDLSRVEWITDTKSKPVGQTMKLKNIKNKFARPGLTGEVDAYVVDHRNHKAGTFDVTKDIVSAAMAYGVFVKQGSHYLFEGDKWYGRPNVEKALKADAKLRGRVKRAVLTAAAAPMPPTDQVRKKTVAKRSASKSVGLTRAASVKKSRGPAAQRVRQREQEA